MATLGLTGLEALLGSLKLETPIPQFPSTSVLHNPLDISRSYLASIIDGLVEGDASLAYGAIQWPNNIYNGDLSVILPKLEHRADPAVLGQEVMSKVGEFFI